MKMLNGPLLRELRQDRELSVLELSDRIAVDRRTLTAYERRSPVHASVAVVASLADFYDLTIEELLIEAAPDLAESA